MGGKKKEYKKNCTQVVTPDVDNSSPCKDFNWSECIILNKDSRVVNLPPDSNMNEYIYLLEGEILRMRNEMILIKRKMNALQECCGGGQSSGIGIF